MRDSNVQRFSDPIFWSPSGARRDSPIRCIVGLEIKLPSKLEAVIYSLPLCKAFG